MNKFFICPKCGKLVLEFGNKRALTCDVCGEKMQRLVPNTVDAAVEKHKPFVTFNDNCVLVKVGEVAHPMLENHYIKAIFLQTTKGFYSLELVPETEPVARFNLKNEKPLNAYAYCNLHGLWQTEIKE